jgi:hypothetical protein
VSKQKEGSKKRKSESDLEEDSDSGDKGIKKTRLNDGSGSKANKK